jgi:hypothetical protein
MQVKKEVTTTVTITLSGDEAEKLYNILFFDDTIPNLLAHRYPNKEDIRSYMRNLRKAIEKE